MLRDEKNLDNFIFNDFHDTWGVLFILFSQHRQHVDQRLAVEIQIPQGVPVVVHHFFHVGHCEEKCEPGHEKMYLMPYANNKGADQPAHPRSLISAFVVRC